MRILKLQPTVIDAACFAQFGYMLQETAAERMGLFSNGDLKGLQMVGLHFDQALARADCTIDAEFIEIEGLKVQEHRYNFGCDPAATLVVHGVFEHQIQATITVLKQFGFDLAVSPPYCAHLHAIYWLMCDAVSTYR